MLMPRQHFLYEHKKLNGNYLYVDYSIVFHRTQVRFFTDDVFYIESWSPKYEGGAKYGYDELRSV